MKQWRPQAENCGSDSSGMSPHPKLNCYSTLFILNYVSAVDIKTKPVLLFTCFSFSVCFGFLIVATEQQQGAAQSWDLPEGEKITAATPQTSQPESGASLLKWIPIQMAKYTPWNIIYDDSMKATRLLKTPNIVWMLYHWWCLTYLISQLWLKQQTFTGNDQSHQTITQKATLSFCSGW